MSAINHCSMCPHKSAHDILKQFEFLLKISSLNEIKDIHSFKQLIFNSTSIQDNKHSLPHLTFMFHR